MAQMWWLQMVWMWRSSQPCMSFRTCTPPKKPKSRSLSEDTSMGGWVLWTSNPVFLGVKSYCSHDWRDTIMYCVKKVLAEELFPLNLLVTLHLAVIWTSTWRRPSSSSSLDDMSFPTRELIFSLNHCPDSTTYCGWGPFVLCVAHCCMIKMYESCKHNTFKRIITF